jgi:outer membrane receptor protein involved in Fe transport
MYRYVAAGLSLAGLTTSLAAQTAPATPPDADTDDQVIVLSEFTVNETANRGYVASETMTGSRIATPIIDLPYTVNVITSEFFDDFAMFELGDNVTQIGGFGGLDIGGGFQLRGFSSSSQLRDGFYRLGRYGSSNIDRMEVIKGSNAAIYGRTSPGGMINMISKQPKERESYRLQLNVGDYGTRRATFEATGRIPGSPRTSYILTASYYERDFDMAYAKNRNQEYYLALKHKFKDGSSLFVSAEYFLQKRDSAPGNAPVIIDQKGTTSTADDLALGYATAISEISANGPNSELNRGNNSVTAVYEKRFSSVWSARAAGNLFQARRWDFNNGGWPAVLNINAPTTPAGVTPVPAGGGVLQRGNNPNKGLIFEDGGGVQADLLARYSLFNNRVDNRTLVTIDINDYYRYDPTWNFGDPATNPTLLAWNSPRNVRLGADLRPLDEIQYFPSMFQWGDERLSRLTKRRATSYGGLFRHQSAFLNNKVLTFMGARFDRVRFRHRDWTTAVNQFAAVPGYVQGQMIDRTVNELKPNAGVNVKLNSNLRAFINYSESYFVNQTENTNVLASANYKSEIADGWDYGIKGSYLQDKLHFTLSGFYATRSNVRVTDTEFDEFGNATNITRPDGDQLVRGYEADLSWSVTPTVTIGGSYGNVYSIYTDFGSQSPRVVGRRVNNVPPENGNVYIKWAPSAGRLKGFSTNLQASYVAAAPSESPTDSGDVYTNVGGRRVFVSTNYRYLLRSDRFTTVDLGLRYKFQGSGRIEHTVAMNVNNLLDEEYLKSGRRLGDRRAFYFSYIIGFAGER